MRPPGLAQRLLYQTPPGRALLRLLVAPPVSVLAGKLCDSAASAALVDPFISRNRIDLEECRRDSFFSFNDFFTRQLRPGSRPVDPTPEALISPSDGYAAAFPIGPDTLLLIKNTSYTVAELLGGDQELAARFEGGFCCVVRLVPQNYHRYCYVDGGLREPGRRIEGLLHTVHPVAHRRGRFLATNTREYTLLHSEHFGQLIQIEVGAMMVGRIVNLQTGLCAVARGQEKGYFEFGGSTVVLLLQKDSVQLNEVLLQAGREGGEIPVRQGQTIGRAPCSSTVEF